MPKAPVDRSVAAVERTLSILDAFLDGEGSLSLSELEERTGLFKSVICRYMLSFERSGYIVKISDGIYKLGPRSSQLGRSYERGLNLEEVVMPILKGLSRDTSESASFYVHDRDSRLCLFRVDSARALRVSNQPGSRLPLDASATGQAFSTYLLPGCKLPTSLTDLVITHSSNVGPDETSSMALPIFGTGRDPVGALTISGPTTRFDPVTHHEARGMLLRAARLLCKELGADARLIA